MATSRGPRAPITRTTSYRSLVGRTSAAKPAKAGHKAHKPAHRSRAHKAAKRRR